MTRRRRFSRSTTSVNATSAPPGRVRLIGYTSEQIVEFEVTDWSKVRDALTRWSVVWLNLEGLSDTASLQQVQNIFQLHPLALEDAVHVHQRAKVEQFGDQLFVVAHMIQYQQQLNSEQLSMFLGSNFVVTFQQGLPGDCFDAVRQRLLRAVGLLRHRRADYLAYTLLDAIIDAYFPVLEELGEQLEQLEQDCISQPQRATLTRLHGLKRELLNLRRLAWPLREATNSLVRDPHALIQEETRIYFRDCYDHAVRILDFVETERELAADLMDLYLSNVSQRMTEVMRVLTIISTLFIPLTFISSIYGMNFDPDASPWNMPELRWYFGYPLALTVMVVVGLSMIWYFRAKGWLTPIDLDLSKDQQEDTQPGITSPSEKS
ncbi:MAG: Cobalt/magnesium transport protein CorA [Phycisphaerae bacterium]|nr:Cobalt/magnesium transport protein CorA [Phycisphaerae bacterium]